MRKTTPFRFCSLNLFLAAAAVLVCGCKNSSDGSGSIGSGNNTIVISGSQELFTPTCFSVNNSSSILQYSWTVGDAYNSPSAGYLGCGSPNQAQFCCSFETNGTKTIYLNAINHDGHQIQLTTQSNISESSGQAIPVVVVDVYDPSGTLQGTISQDAINIRSIKLPSLLNSTNYTFDLRRSSPGMGLSGASGITITNTQISFGTGYTTVGPPGTSITQSFSKSNIYPVSATVTNSIGTSSTLTFQLFVECGVTNFSIDPTKLSVTAGSTLNSYTYDFSNIVSGGIGPFNYVLDVNGDGIYDTQWTQLSQPYSSSNQSLYVSINPTLPYYRNVSIQVWDTGCNNVKSAVLSPATFPKPLPAPSFAPSASRSHFSGTRSRQLRISGGKYRLVTDHPGDQRHECFISRNTSDWRQRQSRPSSVLTPEMHRALPRVIFTVGNDATFQIGAQLAYPNPNPATPLRPDHGLTFKVTGISDTSGGGAGSGIDLSNAAISTLAYTTDSQEDYQPQYSFLGGPQNCHLANLSVRPTATPQTCDGSNASVPSTYTVNVQGDFSCSALSSVLPAGSTGAIAIGNNNTGHFFCQAQIPVFCKAVHECNPTTGKYYDDGTTFTCSLPHLTDGLCTCSCPAPRTACPYGQDQNTCGCIAPPDDPGPVDPGPARDLRAPGPSAPGPRSRSFGLGF